MDPGEELVDVVDDGNEVVGVAPRRTVRDENLLHRCTYVFVLNAAGELYIHKRTDTKDVYPGFYDVGAGGVNAAGESYEGCARRELEEELGVAAEPIFRFLHRYEGPSGRVWGGAFDVVWDGPIVWQPSEELIAWLEQSQNLQDNASFSKTEVTDPFMQEAMRVFPGLAPADRVIVDGLDTPLDLGDAADGIRTIYEKLLDQAWSEARARGEKLPPLSQKDIPPTVPGQQ